MFTSMSVYIFFPCRTLDLTTRDITGPETTCPVELQFVGAGELLLAKLLTPIFILAVVFGFLMFFS